MVATVDSSTAMADVREPEMSQTADFLREQRTQTHQTQRSQSQPQESARESDHPRLDQALAEDGAAIGSEGAAHADVTRASHDFREHQPHGIEQANDEEAERHQHQDSSFR